MKFIFPKNYDFSFKLFGFIDYSVVFVNVIYGFILYFFINLLIYSLSIKIYLFLLLFLPFFLFTAFNMQKENIFFVFLYLFKYIKRQKIYFYSKF